MKRTSLAMQGGSQSDHVCIEIDDGGALLDSLDLPVQFGVKIESLVERWKFIGSFVPEGS